MGVWAGVPRILGALIPKGNPWEVKLGLGSWNPPCSSSICSPGGSQASPCLSCPVCRLSHEGLEEELH